MALTINSLDTISKKVSHMNLTNNLVIVLLFINIVHVLE